MTIIGRLSDPEGKNGIASRVYIHDAGLEDTFEGSQQTAMYYARDVISHNNLLFLKDNADYLIGIVWGNEGKAEADSGVFANNQNGTTMPTATNGFSRMVSISRYTTTVSVSKVSMH